MKVGVPKETRAGERRVALVPDLVQRYVKLGGEVIVEHDAGKASFFLDEHYREAGATIVAGPAEVYAVADFVLKVQRPQDDEVGSIKNGAALVALLQPLTNTDLIKKLADGGVTSFSMDAIPRIARAQKMDALSSQANLAGYVTVVLAATHCPKIFPMMMTPAGTIAPSRVFVIGAGVAGLQAIATAKRLGARVDAFDTRPVVAEQVQSLGGKFIEIDLGEVGQTEQGYAKELMAEQIELQKQGQKRVISQSDVVITTAQVFGRPAPQIVSRDMVEAMQPGSVVVDMAVETGGNVEGSVLDEVVDVGGVKIIGQGNLPSQVARHASDMYSNNLFNLLDDFWDPEEKKLNLDPEDEIIQGCVITRDGAIVNETIKNL